MAYGTRYLRSESRFRPSERNKSGTEEAKEHAEMGIRVTIMCPVLLSNSIKSTVEAAIAGTGVRKMLGSGQKRRRNRHR